MPRMRILIATEQEQFEKPPDFDDQQRKNILEFSEGEVETALTFRKTNRGQQTMTYQSTPTKG